MQMQDVSKNKQAVMLADISTTQYIFNLLIIVQGDK